MASFNSYRKASQRRQVYLYKPTTAQGVQRYCERSNTEANLKQYGLTAPEHTHLQLKADTLLARTRFIR